MSRGFIRVSVIGCGTMGNVHAANFSRIVWVWPRTRRTPLCYRWDELSEEEQAFAEIFGAWMPGNYSICDHVASTTMVTSSPVG